MKTLVIHPKDRTTDFLRAIYEGMEDVTVIREPISNADMATLLHKYQNAEIILLGHGSKDGLFYRLDDTKDDFDGLILKNSSKNRFYLSKARKLVCIFCNADQFVNPKPGVVKGFHGCLCTGMYISEHYEAEECGVHTTQEELNDENRKFAKRLGMLLREDDCLMHEIPEKMKTMDDTQSELTCYNYERIYFL